MAYAESFPWLRHSFIRIQAADRVVRRLPSCDERRRVLEHLEAAERALNALDRKLEDDASVAIECPGCAEQRDTGARSHFGDHSPSCPRSE